MHTNSALKQAASLSLYTVILDYRGGTYIRQVAASNQNEALLIWSRSIVPGEILHLGKKRISRIASEIEANYADSYTPVLIHGAVNVWCTGLPVTAGLVNIIKTEVRL
ncbi:hypothetical protein [Paucibacter sp. XJ19-41]|uniref:hypothetical protein n=1 Tax=Paucibacter sp. XJ19-41 TaxID=2927824 RepID=UPI00234A9AE9|nr:hypothetical protein [Paucibacter sp. XJ19-41]MDC6169647.1 hypothetical protein [Paucibacter sp. XJ19-41]